MKIVSNANVCGSIKSVKGTRKHVNFSTPLLLFTSEAESRVVFLKKKQMLRQVRDRVPEKIRSGAHD